MSNLSTVTLNGSRTEQMAFSIAEFLKRNKLSAATYYKMKAQGLAPKEMRFGSMVRISVEEEAAWRHARTNPASDELAAVRTNSEKLRKRALGAVAKAPHVAAARAGGAA